MTTDTIYKSKIGLEILIPVVLVMGMVTAFMMINSVWFGALFCLLIWLLLFNIYTKTYYKITSDNRLIIKCWIMESWEIEIKDIVSIRKSNSVISSPALSFDRLEITFKGGQVLISPTSKKQFIDTLRKINSKI